jgi:hypothetical protein
MRFVLLTALILGAGTASVPAQITNNLFDPAAGGTVVLGMEVLEEGSDTWQPVVAAESVSAGCRVNLSASNGGNGGIRIFNLDSQVRTRVGWWKALVNIGMDILPVNPGTTIRTVLELSMACSASRRYRFALEKFDGPFNSRGDIQGLRLIAKYMAYYPSSSTFTTSTEVKLGNLNRFF